MGCLEVFIGRFILHGWRYIVIWLLIIILSGQSYICLRVITVLVIHLVDNFDHFHHLIDANQ